MTLNTRSGFRSIVDHEADKFDVITRSVTSIPNAHRLGHLGMVYHASAKTTGIANGADADFLMVIPEGTFPHIQRVELNLEAGDVDLVMYEDTVTSADGGALPAFNVNRNSANVAQAITYGGPTITDLGTEFHRLWVPPTSSGVGNTVGVLDVNQGEEWILKDNTKYAFRITNNSGGVIDLSFEFVWYEVDWTKAGS